MYLSPASAKTLTHTQMEGESHPLDRKSHMNFQRTPKVYIYWNIVIFFLLFFFLASDLFPGQLEAAKLLRIRIVTAEML